MQNEVSTATTYRPYSLTLEKTLLFFFGSMTMILFIPEDPSRYTEAMVQSLRYIRFIGIAATALIALLVYFHAKYSITVSEDGTLTEKNGGSTRVLELKDVRKIGNPSFFSFIATDVTPRAFRRPNFALENDIHLKRFPAYAMSQSFFDHVLRLRPELPVTPSFRIVELVQELKGPGTYDWSKDKKMRVINMILVGLMVGTVAAIYVSVMIWVNMS